MNLYTIPVPEAGPDALILYRPLSGLAFMGNQSLASLSARLVEEPDLPVRADIRQFLQSIGFFEPDPPPPDAPTGELQPLGVTLLLTNQCQLRCTYCYAAAGEFKRQVLPLEYGQLAIDAAVDTLLRIGYPRLELSLHGGGEPTFPWKTLQTLVAYARKKPVQVSVSMTSNGVWSEQQTQWILAYIDGLTLSMDGRPETQDRQRPLASGRSSSAWVMRTIAALDQHSFPYGIRMTALPPWENLPGDVEFLCQNTGCQNIHVEPAFNTQRGEECGPQGEESMAFARAYLEAHHIASQAGRQLVYSGARLENVSAVFCGSAYHNLIVNPQGDLVACYTTTSSDHVLAEHTRIGRIEGGKLIIQEAARARLHNKLSERRSACKGCYCYWSCAGDCFAKYLPSGDHLKFDGRCDINRTLLKELLLRRMAQNNGVWMRYSPCHEYPSP